MSFPFFGIQEHPWGEGGVGANSERNQVVPSGQRRWELRSRRKKCRRAPRPLPPSFGPQGPSASTTANNLGKASEAGGWRRDTPWAFCAPSPSPPLAHTPPPTPRHAPGDSGSSRKAVNRKLGSQGAGEGTCAFSPPGGQQWNNRA